MKPKIWCLGLSRTGTSTLTEVLNMAGLNHIHYPTHWDMFHGINDGAGDISVIPFYKELDKKYPNSKFIHTVRQKDDWLRSMKPYLERKKEWKQSQFQIDIRKKVYNNAFFDYNTYSEAYDKHYRDVQDYFKNRKYDFLTLDILGGDKPSRLFDFLGMACPCDEFPHYNKLVDGKGVRVA